MQKIIGNPSLILKSSKIEKWRRTLRFTENNNILEITVIGSSISTVSTQRWVEFRGFEQKSLEIFVISSFVEYIKS